MDSIFSGMQADELDSDEGEESIIGSSQTAALVTGKSTSKSSTQTSNKTEKTKPKSKTTSVAGKSMSRDKGKEEEEEEALNGRGEEMQDADDDDADEGEERDNGGDETEDGEDDKEKLCTTAQKRTLATQGSKQVSSKNKGSKKKTSELKTGSSASNKKRRKVVYVPSASDPRVKEEFQPALSVPLRWEKYHTAQLSPLQPVCSEAEAGISNRLLRTQLLNHIYGVRQDQNLPPVFALLTGPTLERPYRMEEKVIYLGRRTSRTNLAQVHVGNVSTISRAHAAIELSTEDDCYNVVNLSHKGISVKRGPGEFIRLTEKNAKYPLANPSVIIIENAVIFFQLFYITRKAVPLWTRYPFETQDPFPVKLRNKSSSSASSSLSSSSHPKTLATSAVGNAKYGANSVPKRKRLIFDRTTKASNPASITYVELLLEAMIALGGRAPQKEIARYIEANFQYVLIAKKVSKTWKNSLSGILSTHEEFHQEAAFLPNGRKARFSTWVMDGAEAEIERRRREGLAIPDPIFIGPTAVEQVAAEEAASAAAAATASSPTASSSSSQPTASSVAVASAATTSSAVSSATTSSSSAAPQ
mmetsp:Transcript_1631/g.5040  ORF Transcript_1631/g.5040 Transcript_1631/m.5040 type:complete len:587 (+) Transcript_1631:2024-3784(+)